MKQKNKKTKRAASERIKSNRKRSEITYRGVKQLGIGLDPIFVTMMERVVIDSKHLRRTV